MATKFIYHSKKQVCHLCNGNKKTNGKRAVFVINTDSSAQPVQTAEDLSEFVNDDTCPACNGTGENSVPPFNNGEKAKISDKKVSELASAATLLRCIGDSNFVLAIATESARILLPDDIVSNYVGYWSDPGRDVNLGEYIRQIAQTAEELAEKTYGDLGNRIFASPRPHKEHDDSVKSELASSCHKCGDGTGHDGELPFVENPSAKEDGIEVFHVPHVSSRGNDFVLLSDVDAYVSQVSAKVHERCYKLLDEASVKARVEMTKQASAPAPTHEQKAQAMRSYQNMFTEPAGAGYPMFETGFLSALAIHYGVVPPVSVGNT